MTFFEERNHLRTLILLRQQQQQHNSVITGTGTTNVTCTIKFKIPVPHTISIEYPDIEYPDNIPHSYSISKYTQ